MLVGRVVAGLRGAERRHLDHFGADMHVHEAEAAADDERAAEQRLDLLGRRVGRDVEVLGLDAEQQVAHRAADDERLEARVLQPARDRARRRGQLVAAHRMLGRARRCAARSTAGRAAGGRAGGGSSRDGSRCGCASRERKRPARRRSRSESARMIASGDVRREVRGAGKSARIASACGDGRANVRRLRA